MDRTSLDTPAEGTALGDAAATVVSALAQTVKRDPSSISRETRLFEDLAFDSTSVLELLMQLEDDLDIEFDPELLDPTHFETVGSLVDYVTDMATEQRQA
jgi:acyl carrier protein